MIGGGWGSFLKSKTLELRTVLPLWSVHLLEMSSLLISQGACSTFFAPVEAIQMGFTSPPCNCVHGSL